MQVTREELPDSQIVLEITVKDERLEKAKAAAYRRVASKAKIPGFRPGKAPREVVERHFKAQRISGGDSTQWSEAGADLGTHLDGAKVKTIDELYTVCAEEILTIDEETHWINLFVDSSDGIMRNCSASHRLCNDDCSFGPNIATVEF